MKKLMTALETVLQAHFMPAFLVQICLSCLLASCNQIELSERPVLISPIEGLDSVLVRQYLDTGLPVVWIKTVNDEEPVYEIADPPKGCWGGSIQQATKVPGRVVVQTLDGVVYDSGEYVEQRSGMTVKVRGNWSARKAKKPFKIKLQTKADLLGRGERCFEDKDWILMPFYSLNNMIGLKVNELMGLQWTPQYMFVNVVFNGDYRGLYMLMESVERNVNCRLNVDKTGYVMELDAYWWKEDNYVLASFEEPLNYTFKYPQAKHLTIEHLNYIQKVLNEAEESTRNGSYPDKIDVESFARWMLAHDILGNTDGAGSNIFLTKYDNTDASLLKMGCLWDFDVIMKSEGWDEIHGRYYFKGLFSSENKAFWNLYVEIWNESKDLVFNELFQYLGRYMASDLRRSVDTSIELSNERWAGLSRFIPLSSDYVEAAIQYFNQRKTWLEKNINIR